MRQPATIDPVPEEQHREMRRRQGRVHVETAAGALYFAALDCQKDGMEWPSDLDAAHKILWKHLGRSEAVRRRVLGLAEEQDGAQPRRGANSQSKPPQKKTFAVC